MNIFKKLFQQNKKLVIEDNVLSESLPSIEKKLIPEIKSMLEIAFEYCNFNTDEVENIYIFNSTEESIYFTFFFKVKGQLVERHEINSLLNKKCDDSADRQFACDDIGQGNLENIINLFEHNDLQVPYRITIEFDTSINKMNTNFSYEKRLIGTKLTCVDLISEWWANLS